MAISSRKISGLKELSNLSGEEYLMVAFNNRSYKVKTSLFTSDIIPVISKEIVLGGIKLTGSEEVSMMKMTAAFIREWQL